MGQVGYCRGKVQRYALCFGCGTYAGCTNLLSATTVIDERIITPGAFVNIVFKARLSSPLDHLAKSAEESKHDERDAEAEDETAFLLGKKEGGDLKAEDAPQSVHAPRWPAVSTFRPILYQRSPPLTPPPRSPVNQDGGASSQTTKTTESSSRPSASLMCRVRTHQRYTITVRTSSSSKHHRQWAPIPSDCSS